MSFTAGVLALLIGITLGLLGGGGSILTVPVFVYALGFEPKLAIAMSLPVVGGAALVGAARHWMIGNVTLRTALPFGAAAMVSAFLGAKLAQFVPGTVQLVILAVVMLGAAFSMFRNAAAVAPLALPALPALPAEDSNRRRIWKLIAIGTVVGMLTGLVGVGGGFLIVPALVLLAGVAMSQAVGTSLLLIAMNTLTGFIGYQGTVEIPWGFVVKFGALTAVGILVGSSMLRFVSQRLLKRSFAVLLVFVSAFILWQSRAMFMS